MQGMANRKSKSRLDKILSRTATIATILGSIAIPVVISFAQAERTQKIERQNRKVGIAKILSDNYKADCQKRSKTATLIKDWFNIKQNESKKLSNYINPNCDEKNKEARKTLNELALVGYKINIHFRKKYQKELKPKAETIREYLLNRGVSQEKVKIEGLPQEWFEKTGGLSSNQIRYEEGSEKEAASALKNILNKRPNHKRDFQLQTIYGTSPNSVSIFIKR